MKQFVLQQGSSPELQLFPDIIEIGSKKNISIQLDSMPVLSYDFLRVYCVLEGKFEWRMQGQQFVVYPGDIVLVLPNQVFGGAKGFLEIGNIAWLYLNVTRPENGNLYWGAWSSLNESERQTIGNIMLLNHTGCGFTTFTDAELNAKLSASTGDASPAPMRFFSYKDPEENTREQIKKVRSHPWIAKDIPVRGFVFDVDTGGLHEVKLLEDERAA